MIRRYLQDSGYITKEDGRDSGPALGRKAYEAETRIVGLGENGMLRFEDEFGEDYLVSAFVDLVQH